MSEEGCGQGMKTGECTQRMRRDASATARHHRAARQACRSGGRTGAPSPARPRPQRSATGFQHAAIRGRGCGRGFAVTEGRRCDGRGRQKLPAAGLADAPRGCGHGPYREARSSKHAPVMRALVKAPGGRVCRTVGCDTGRPASRRPVAKDPTARLAQARGSSQAKRFARAVVISGADLGRLASHHQCITVHPVQRASRRARGARHGCRSARNSRVRGSQGRCRALSTPRSPMRERGASYLRPFLFFLPPLCFFFAPPAAAPAP